MTAEVQSETRKVVSVNPSTGEVFAAFEPASEQEVVAAVTRARSAQPEWNRIGVERRAQILANFQRRLQESQAGNSTVR